MDEIGVVSPEQMRELVQFYRAFKQLPSAQTKHYPERRPVDEVSPHRVFIHNASGEAIPSFGCCRITGVEVVGGRTALTVEKPSSTDGEFIFNSHFPIAIDGTGWAFRYGVVHMLGDAPLTVGAEYSPIVSSWEIEEAPGPFIVFGRHDFSSRALVGRFSGGGSSIQLIDALVIECLDEGFYLVELADMPDFVVPDTADCDPCTGDCNAPTTSWPRTLPIGRGVYVTAYDSRKLPMEIGGHCVLANMGDIEVGGGQSGDNIVYRVIVPARGIESFNVEDWECCPTGIQLTSCETYYGELVRCPAVTTPCPE